MASEVRRLSAVTAEVMQDKYYDSEKQYKIPSAPWSYGDNPVEGRTHVDIYISGYKYGSSYQTPEGRPRQLDGDIQCDRRGVSRSGNLFDLHDHQRDKNATVYGHWVNGSHDGHCPAVKWNMAHSPRCATILAAALGASFRIILEDIAIKFEYW